MSFQLHDKIELVNGCFENDDDETLLEALMDLREFLEYVVSDKSEVKAVTETFFLSGHVFFNWLNKSNMKREDSVTLLLISILKNWIELHDVSVVSLIAKTAFENLFRFIKQASSSKKVVVIACKCLDKIIEVCQEFEYSESASSCSQLFTDVFTRIRSGKEKSAPVQEALLTLLGSIATSVPSVIEPHKAKFEEIMITGVKTQIESNRKFESTITAGYIAALNGLYNQFSPSPQFVSKMFNLILIVLKPSAFVELSRYNMHTNALNFVKNHCDKFAKLVLLNYEDLYGKLDFFVQQSNSGVSHAAHEAMTAYQETILRYLPKIIDSNQPDPDQVDGKALFVFIYNKLFATFSEVEPKAKKLSLAIEGLGKLSPLCERFLGSEQLRNLFRQMMEKCNQMRLSYLLASEVGSSYRQSNPSQRIAHFSNFISAISSTILYNSHPELLSLAANQLNCLITFCSFVVTQFPYHLPPQQKWTSRAVTMLLGAIYEKQLSFESFLSQFWTQTLLRSCQHALVNAYVQIDSSTLTSEKVFSYKDYLPFVHYFLEKTNYCVLIDEGSDLGEKEIDQIWRKSRLEFIETTFNLISSLNLKTRKGHAQTANNVSLNVTPVNPSDFEVFANLVEIWHAVFESQILASNLGDLEIELLLSSTEKLIGISQENFEISGFFKLLSTFMDLLFRNEHPSGNSDFQSNHLETTLNEYVQRSRSSVHLFSNELLISFLSFFFKIPMQIVASSESSLTEAQRLLKTALSLQHLPTAKLALNFLNSLIDAKSFETKSQIVLEIAPAFYPYLCANSNSFAEGPDATLVRKKNARSKIKDYDNFSLINCDPEELQNFQEKILVFLSKVSLPINSSLFIDASKSPKSLISVNYLEDPKIVYAVPFQDTKPTISFDPMLPVVIELAEKSPDRKTKVAACEFFHALCVLTIGKNAQTQSASYLQQSFVSIYELIFPAIIRLAADNDPIAKQLFEPLCLQCIHWFTSMKCQNSPETACLVKCIFDQLCTDHDMGVRSFAALCVKEFLDWSIKHCVKDEELLNSTRIKHICKLISFNAKNPSLKLKMAAIEAFNASKRSLREHSVIVDAFLIEWLMSFLELLRSTEDIDNESLAQQCSEVIRSLILILSKYSKIFEKPSARRRVLTSYGFENGTVDEIASVLAQSIGSREVQYRRILLETIQSISCVSLNRPPTKFFKELIDIKRCKDVFEKSTSSLKCLKIDATSNQAQLQDFARCLLAMLDCYIWALEVVKLDSSQLFKTANVQLWQFIEDFMSYVLFKINSSEVVSRNMRFEKLSSFVVVSLMRFVNVLNRVSRSKDVFKVLMSNVITEKFCEVVSLAVFRPSEIGFSRLSENEQKSLSEIVCETCQVISSLSTHRFFLENSVKKFLFTEEGIETEVVFVEQLKRLFGMSDQTTIKCLVSSWKLSLNAFPSLFAAEFRSKLSNSIIQFLRAEKSTNSFVRSDLIQHLFEFAWELNFDAGLFFELFTEVFRSQFRTSSTTVPDRNLVQVCEKRLCQQFVDKVKDCLEFPEKILHSDFQLIMNSTSKCLDLWFVNRRKWEITNKKESIECLEKLVCWILQKVFKTNLESEAVSTVVSILTNLIAVDEERILSRSENCKDFVNFVLFVLERELPLSVKCNSLELLPFVFSLQNEDYTIKICDKLKFFLSDELTIEESMHSESIPGGFVSNQPTCFVEKCYDRLFLTFRTSASLDLFKILIPAVCRTQEFPFLAKFNKCFLSFISSRSFDVNAVKEVFKEALQLSVGNYSLVPNVRRRVFERILLIVISNVPLNIFKAVFVEQMALFLSPIDIFEKSSALTLLGDADLEDKVLDVEIVFDVMTAALQVLPPSEFANVESELNLKFRKISARDSKMTLMKFMLQTSANCKNGLLVGSCGSNPEVDIKLRNAAYRCLVFVIVNCVNKYEFFLSFLLDEKPKNQKFWLSVLLDTGSMFEFAAEVSSPDAVKMKRLQLRTRRSQTKAVTNDVTEKSTGTQKTYLSSQFVLESSLREELAQFDFNDAFVQNPPIQNPNVNEDAIDTSDQPDSVNLGLNESVLEDPVTSLKLFEVTVLIVKHLQTFESAFSESSFSGGSQTLGSRDIPSWVSRFKQQLQSSVHINVSIFVAKVIITCEQSFSPYSESIISDLIRVLESYLAKSRLLSSFAVELVCLVADWSRKSHESKEKFRLSSEDSSRLNRIMSLMIQSAAHKNTALFRNNVELIKIMLENFKTYIQFDYDIIFEKLKAKNDEKTPELDCGIQVLGLIAAQKMPVFPNISIIEKGAMFQTLLKLLNHSNVTVFAPAAETIGLVLSHHCVLEEATEKLFFEELNNLSVKALMDIKQSSNRLNAQGKFFTVFSYICDRFPKFGREIIDQAFFSLPSLTSKFKVYCLKVIYHHCDSQEKAFVTLRDHGILGPYLSNINESIQVWSLKVLEKMASIMSSSQAYEVVNALGEKIRDPMVSSNSRQKMFQALMELHKHNKDRNSDLSDKILKLLISGIVDDDRSISLVVLSYISKLDLLPQLLPDRILYLLKAFYDHDNNIHFMKYATNLIFDVCQQCPDYNRMVFDLPLDKCEFHGLQLQNMWLSKHSAMLPMFVDTQPLTRMVESLSSTNQIQDSQNVLRATSDMKDLNFTATNARSAISSSFSWLDDSYGDLSSTGDVESFESTLLADVREESRRAAPSKGRRRILVRTDQGFREQSSAGGEASEGKLKSRDRVRLTALAKRESNQEKSYHVRKAYEAAKERSRSSVESSLRRRNDVTVYRDYRVGDIPDIQIKHSDLLIPLLALAQKDSRLCSLLFVHVCKGVIDELRGLRNHEEDHLTRFSEVFNSILNSCRNFGDEFLVNSLVSISVTVQGSIKLDLPTLTKCAIANSQELAALAYVEEISLKSGDLDMSSSTSKRRKIASYEPENSAHLYLLKLYRALGDLDHVHAYDVGKFPEVTKSLMKLENQRKFNEAVHSSEMTIKECREIVSDEETEVWEDVCTRSLAALCDWENLGSMFDDVLNLDSEDCGKLLAEYSSQVDAKCKTLIDDTATSSEFCTYLESVTNEWKSRKDFSSRLPLNMCMILLKQGYPFNAKDILKKYAFPKLQRALQRVLLPRGFGTLSNSEVSDLFHAETQLLKFFQTDFDNLNESTAIKFVETVNKFELDSLNIPLSTWEEIRLARKTCLGFLEDKFSTESHSNRKLGLVCEQKLAEFDIGFVVASLDQTNLELAQKLLAKVRRSELCRKDRDLSFKCELANVDYLLKLSNVHDNPEIVSSHFKQAINALLKFRDVDFVTGSHKEFSLLMSALARSFLSLFNLNAETQSIIEGIPITHNNAFPDKFLLPWNEKPSGSLAACYQMLLKTCDFPLEQDIHVLAQTHYDLGLFCLNVLSDSQRSTLDSSEDNRYLTTLLTSTCEAMRKGKIESNALFPRLISLLASGTASEDSDLRQTFVAEVSSVPNWMFLNWIDQIVSFLCESNVKPMLIPLINSVAREYPQAIYFPFKLSIEGNKRLSDKIIKKLETLVANSKWERILQELYRVALTPSAVVGELIRDISKAEVEERKKLFLEARKELFGNEDHKIPACEFQKLIENKCKSKFEAVSGAKGEKLASKDLKSLKTELDSLKVLANAIDCPSTLQEYSSYLANFSQLNPYSDIEIPGQYSGNKKPNPDAHVKISGFRQEVRVMESMRKPRKIGILGSNEQEYPFLLKCGEDLRQDARIMKVFGLMNEFLKQNAETKQRELFLQTYDVIAMTTKLGLIQWVSNTTVYQSFFEQICGEERLGDAKKEMQKTVLNFLRCIPRELGQKYHLWTKKASNSEALQVIEKSSSVLGVFSLRKALGKLSSSPDAFIVLRDRFLRSYSTMCLCHYILGIGDRHTSNTLINLHSGTAIGIDFGHAFGTATQFLPVPELIPFRLTPLLTHLTVPKVSANGGLVYATTLKVLEALKQNEASLMNVMEVFLKEPVIDWADFAQRQVNAMRRAGNLESDLEESAMQWYPQQKVDYVRQKLRGANPICLMKCELDLNVFVMKDTPLLMSHLRASQSSDAKKSQTSEMQVTCLIEQATDLKLLGRTWIGWTPFA